MYRPDFTLCFLSEANGIHPLLVLLKGHILVGAWLTEDIYHQTVGDDASFLLKGSANGISDIVLVETTALASSQNISFEEPPQWLRENSKKKTGSSCLSIYIDADWIKSVHCRNA